MYPNSGCGVSLINKEWFYSQLPNEPILKIALPIYVRGILVSRYKTIVYVILPVYLHGVDNNGSKVLVTLRCREFYLINNLRAYILIRNDVIGPEEISIDITKRKATIRSCNGVNIAIDLVNVGNLLDGTFILRRLLLYGRIYRRRCLYYIE